MKKIWPLCTCSTLVCFGLLPLAPGLPKLPEISGVHVESRPRSIVVIVQLSQPVQYRSSRLSEPNRAVFDFPGSRPSIDGRGEATIKVGDSRLLSVRIGETMPGTTRIVLDLAGDVTLESRPAGNQVLIELFGKPPGGHGPGVETGTGVPPKLIDGMQRDSYPTMETLPTPRNLFNELSATASLPVAAFPLSRKGNGYWRVVIDPGHGGPDRGMAAPNGQLEKDFVLDISLRAAELLRRQPKTEVHVTRTADQFVSLGHRTTLANTANADLFVSIHASWPLSSARSGAGVYYLGFSEAPEDLSIAGRENAVGEKTIADFGDLVKTISQNGKAAESKLVAESVMSALNTLVAGRPNSRGEGHARRAPLLVLVGARMPAILANLEFGTGRTKGETDQDTSAVRQRAAQALFDGIVKYRQESIANPEKQ